MAPVMTFTADERAILDDGERRGWRAVYDERCGTTSERWTHPERHRLDDLRIREQVATGRRPYGPVPLYGPNRRDWVSSVRRVPSGTVVCTVTEDLDTGRREVEYEVAP